MFKLSFAVGDPVFKRCRNGIRLNSIKTCSKDYVRNFLVFSSAVLNYVFTNATVKIFNYILRKTGIVFKAVKQILQKIMPRKLVV